MRSLARNLALGAAALVLTTSPARAAALLKPMNLEDLTRRADRIFSGTVLTAAKGRVAMGGGTLPTVTYRIAVDQALAGVPDQGAPQVVEIRMIGDPAEVRRHRLMRLAKATPRPDIQPGQRYVFFLTAPGRTGLSTTVGLGQGLFRVTGGGEDEAVVNQYGNVGLFRATSGTRTPARGPVRYADLAADQEPRDADRFVAGLGYAHAFGPDSLIVYGGIYGGQESEKDAAFPQFGHELYGVRLGAQQFLSEKFSVFANASVETRQYGGPDPFFVVDREDDQYSGAAGVHFVPLRNLRLTLQAAYTDNNSNISINEYDRWLISLILRNEF